MGGSSKGHIQMGGSSKGHIQMGGSDFDTFTGVHLLTDGRFQYRPFTDGRFDRGRGVSLLSMGGFSFSHYINI